jgi:hypothetical protein
MSTTRTNHKKPCHINIITSLLLAPLSLPRLWRVPSAPPHTNHKTPYHIITVCYWLKFLKNTDLSYSPIPSSVEYPRLPTPVRPFVAECNPTDQYLRLYTSRGNAVSTGTHPTQRHPSYTYVTKYHLRFSSPFCPLVPLMSAYPMT